MRDKVWLILGAVVVSGLAFATYLDLNTSGSLSKKITGASVDKRGCKEFGGSTKPYPASGGIDLTASELALKNATPSFSKKNRQWFCGHFKRRR